MWQSYEDTDSAGNVTDIAKMLFKTSIVNDYGNLYPIDVKPEDFAKRTQGNFVTANKIKVQSKSIAQSTRWLNTYDQEWEQTERPDLLIMDDIDVVKSVMNPSIIENNYKKILWEVFGALDPLHNKRIILGNTILEDWVIPRLRQLYKYASDWDIFRQPLISESGENFRPEIFTEDIVAKLKQEWKIAFGQNYLLKPATSGSGIFVREYFDYFLPSHFENVDWFLKKNDVRRAIIVDPAFSSRDTSDDAVFMGLWQHKVSKQYYLWDWHSDTSATSKTISSIIVMCNKMIMDWCGPEFISVEKVDLNKEQTEFIKKLREALLEHQINIPLYLYETKLNKQQRIKDKCEPVLSQKWFKVNRNLDSKFIFKLEKQFLDFPHGDHDDHPDCVAQWIDVFRKRIEKQSEEKKDRTFYSSITGKKIDVQWQWEQYRPRPHWSRTVLSRTKII